jgi:hypothetical protein
MKLPSNFRESLAEKPDGDLYEMLAHADNYLPEALEVAREELECRNLPPQKVAGEVQSVLESSLADEASKNAEPLGWPLRISILILGGIVGLPAAMYYFIKGGYKRKLRESLLWILYAVLFWLGVGILIGILSAMGVI